MQSDAPYSKQIGQIKNIMERINHSVDDILKNDQGEPVVARASSGNDVSYQVILTKPGKEFVVVEYDYNLVYDLSVRIMQENGAFSEEDSPEVNMEEGVRELSTILSEDREQYFDVIQELNRRLNTPDVYYSINRDEADILKGFKTNRNLFIFEDDFSLSDFNEATRVVVSRGIDAQNYLRTQFGINSSESKFSAGVMSNQGNNNRDDLNDEFGRSFI